jgi:MoxR-like ATPase
MPGTGKTILVRAAFEDDITMPGDEDTATEDFTGSFSRIPIEGNDDDAADAWEDGPLAVAMIKGLPFFIDDVTVISPRVMAVVYSVMDGRGTLYVKGRPRKLGREIKAADGFFVCAAHNPGTVGAILSDALASRFLVRIQVPTDLAIVEDQLKVDHKAIQVAANLMHRVDNNQAVWHPNTRELEAHKLVTEVVGEEYAAANIAGVAPAEAREEVLQAVRTVYGNDEIEPLTLGK